MEVTDGTLSYSFLFDTKEGERNIEDVISLFRKLGYSAEEAGELADDFTKELTDSLMGVVKESKDASDAVAKMSQKCKELEDYAASMGEGLDKVRIQALAEGFKAAGEAIEEDNAKFEQLKVMAEGNAKAFKASQVAVKAMSAALKTIGIGIVIKALTELVKLTWQFVDGALKAERAAAAWGMQMRFLKDDLDGMRQYASNMEEIKKATGATREEIRAFRLEQAKLREQTALDNYNAMTQALAKDPRNVSEEDYKKAGELYQKALQDRQQIEHENRLDEIQQQKDQKEIDHNAYMEQLNAQNAQIELLKDGYAKRAQEIKNGREKERAALQHQLDTAAPNSMLESQKRDILEQIRLSSEAEAKELADLYRKQNAAIVEAEKALADAEYDESQKRINQRNKQRQTDIDLMKEGSAKELAQMRQDHETRLVEIEREAKEEADAMIEANKQKWLNEQTKKGHQVTDADWYSSSAYKSLSGGLTEEQRKQIEAQRKQDTANENAIAAKQYDDFLQQMLRIYNNYTASKKAIDDKYLNDLSIATLGMMTSTTEEEKRRYADLMKEIGKERAKETLDLDLAVVDATVYETVEERMEAINKAYEAYIESIRQACASEAEIAAVEQERVETAGRLATINDKIASLERMKLVAVDKGDTEEVKRLNEEIRKLQKQLNDLNKVSSKKSLGTMFKEWADDLKASDLISAGGELANVIANIGEAAGSEAIADLGQALSFAGDVGAKIASGDYLGAVLTVLTDIGDTIASDIAKTKEFENEMRQAAVDADLLRIAAMMDSGDTIFGTSYTENVRGLNDALDAAKEKLDEYKRQANRPNMYMYNVNDAEANWDALTALFGQKVFKTKDYSGFSNFFGKADEFDTLQEFARRNNMELYDEYGNFNRNVLELFKNTYSDLSDEDKQWIDNAIAYTDEYAKAMEELSSYLTDLFGNVADTIADQFINSFLESGQAAMDFDAVVSDVARNMVKNLIRSMIIDEVLKKYTDGFKNIMTSDEYENDEARSAALLSLFMQMGGEIEGLQPAIQTLLETWQQYIGDLDVATASMSGNLLQSASQDSVDMLNGQLNAVRTNQALMVGRVDSVILQLSGIYNEVRDFRGDSNRRLDQLIDNTSERGSIARAFGLA